MDTCHVCAAFLPYHKDTCYVPLDELHTFSQRQSHILREALSYAQSAGVKLADLTVIPAELIAPVADSIRALTTALEAAEQVTSDLADQVAARWAAQNLA